MVKLDDEKLELVRAKLELERIADEVDSVDDEPTMTEDVLEVEGVAEKDREVVDMVDVLGAGQHGEGRPRSTSQGSTNVRKVPTSCC